jgi:acetylornithine aminotransferase/acetylornithine/N-succinyldiaminopimelate aminotransferase
MLLHPKILPLTIQSGEGCYVVDENGRRYLDFASGIGVNALGHNHPRITAAIADQAQKCIHTSNLYSHAWQARLASELCRRAGLDRALFTNSGTEATEAALKLALCHREAKHFVAIEGSFHGRTRGALALAGQRRLRDPFSPLGLDVTFVPPNDEGALEQAVGERTAAVVLEPILGEGGVIPLSEAFLRKAREVTANRGSLLIADECQCGLGRTGRHFAYQWSGIQPDIVTVAKPLAGGLPLGAVLFTEAVYERFPPGTHATTFGGGPLACRVALEFLNEVDGLLEHILQAGAQFRDGLEQLRVRYPVIREVRVRGLMIGVQLNQPAEPFVLAALKRGLLINATQENVIRLLPPYIVTSEQIDEGLSALAQIFADASK